MSGATGIKVDRYAVDHWLPEDGRGPGVTLAFMQEGAEGQLHLLLSQPLAWQLASRVLALLNMEPITPDHPEWDKV